SFGGKDECHVSLRIPFYIMSLSVAYSPSLLKTTIQNFMDITKFRLSVSVVFSSVAGYLLGAENIDFAIVFLLSVVGYCMVGASNVFNQIIERDLDALKNRTKNRPLPAGKMTVKTAFILGVILTIVGLVVLYNINPITALFGAVSIFMYVSLYTP